jgi:tetratricopeptide (TPR) repeat protein
MGFGSITAGTGLLTLGIMNSIRAKDTVNHIGNVEMEYSVNQKECNKNNWNICDRNIYLQYPDGTAVRNQVSNDGSVIFILPETSKLISYGESPELIIYFKSVTPWKLKLNRSTEFQKAFASYNYTQGQILYNEGKFEGALDKIQLAMKYDDVNKEYIVLRDDIIKKITSPLYTKAKYNFKKGNLEDALKDLESALEYEPNSNEYIQLKSSITYKIAYLQMTPLERALTNVYELPDHVESILDLDVMSYFELEDQYNTDLKKKVFKNSKEYKEKIAELKSLKTQTENQLYFINPPFELSEYNVKKGGFEIELGSNMGQGTAMAIAPKSINDIIFSPFPTTQDSFCVMGECAPYGVYVEHLLLPVTEKNGIKIEEQYENIKVYLIFKLGGIKTIKFEYYCTMYGWYTITQKKLFAKWVRVIIANSQNGEVYFDKSYGSK